MKTFVARVIASGFAVWAMATSAAPDAGLPASAASAASVKVKVEDHQDRQDKPMIKAQKKIAKTPQQAGGRPAAPQ
jgi:hypothetical protein